MQKEEEGDYIHVEHSNIPYMAVCFFLVIIRFLAFQTGWPMWYTCTKENIYHSLSAQESFAFNSFKGLVG